MKKIIIVALMLGFLNPAYSLPKFCKVIFSPHGWGTTKAVDYSQTDYIFGLEFTVTNQKIVDEGNRNPKDYGLANNPLKKEALLKFWDLLKEKCAAHPLCKSARSRDKHGEALRLDFSDGFYFTVGNDSAVIEINAKPLSINGFKKHKHYLDDFVFPLAAEAGMAPHVRAGQGHIHISRKAFNEEGTLLRNLFVDFQNRPEIIYGALGNHLFNSPPLAAQKEGQRLALIEFLETLDKKENYSINEFVSGIERKVYTSSHAEDWGSFDYYQAFNMTRLFKLIGSATIEIRSFRPQRNTRDFELQTKLLATWIEKLRGRAPIPYNNKSKYQYTPQEIVNAYYKLIEDLDLSWNEFKVLLPENMYGIKPQGEK